MFQNEVLQTGYMRYKLWAAVGCRGSYRNNGGTCHMAAPISVFTCIEHTRSLIVLLFSYVLLKIVCIEASITASIKLVDHVKIAKLGLKSDPPDSLFFLTPRYLASQILPSARFLC